MDQVHVIVRRIVQSYLQRNQSAIVRHSRKPTSRMRTHHHLQQFIIVRVSLRVLRIRHVFSSSLQQRIDFDLIGGLYFKLKLRSRCGETGSQVGVVAGTRQVDDDKSRSGRLLGGRCRRELMGSSCRSNCGRSEGFIERRVCSSNQLMPSTGVDVSIDASEDAVSTFCNVSGGGVVLFGSDFDSKLEKEKSASDSYRDILDDLHYTPAVSGLGTTPGPAKRKVVRGCSQACWYFGV